jgi:crotonobetainyl-CoA:carnitine CoA-transferase CaiB-like acyl-CoA transferase
MTIGPLNGLRILDMSRILAGPSCTQLLGDMGADVIKVEKPGLGDDTRSWGPPYLTPKEGEPASESAYYLAANRNKRSVALDISSTEGQSQIRALMATCDVVVENFKAGGLDKYNLSYSQIAEEFPHLVWCSITGFGQTGPNAHKPGYDLLAQAFGGLMSITGEADREPMKVGVGITDLCTGLHAATSILAALRHRDATGEGQMIDLSLADVQMAMLANQGTNYLVGGTSPNRAGNQHPNIVPYQVFEVSDGHLIVAVGNDQQFVRFCDIINRADLANDPLYKTNASRVQNRDALLQILSPILKKLDRNTLLSQMEQSGIPGGPINTVAEALDSEQSLARGMRIDMPHSHSADGSVSLIGNPIKFSKTPTSYRHAPPTCGEHTIEVLNELSQKADT